MNTFRPLSLTVQNFRSYGNKPQTIVFPKPGETMLVSGEIGVGKTTIALGITYALCGARGVTGQDIVNDVSGKNCRVTLVGLLNDKEITITRGTKPAILEVTGIDSARKDQMQAELDSILHITDPQLLNNICILSTSRTLPFFTLDKQARLKFLRNFVDTTVLDSLQERSKAKWSANKSERTSLDAKVESLRGSHSRLVRLLEESRVAAKKKSDNIKLSLSTIEVLPDDKLSIAKSDYDELNKKVTANQATKIEFSEARAELVTNLEQQKNALTKILKDASLSGKLSHSSPTKDIESAFFTLLSNMKTAHMKTEEEAAKNVPLTEAELQDIEERIILLRADLEAKDSEHQTAEAERGNLEGEISSLKENITQLVEDQNKVDSEECREYFKDLIDIQQKKEYKNSKDLKKATRYVTNIKTQHKDIQVKIKELEDSVIKSEQIDRRREQLEANALQLKTAIQSVLGPAEEAISISKNLVILQRDLKKASDRLKNISDGMGPDADRCAQLKTLLDQQSSAAERQKDLQNQLDTCFSEPERLKVEVESALEELEETELEREKAVELTAVIDSYRSLLDSVWGHMANKMIPMLNRKLPYYMSALGLDFAMKLDPNDLSKPKFTGKPGIGNRKITALSGGQSRLTSLALAHALRDMEVSVAGMNIQLLFIDEFASGALSPDKVQRSLEFERKWAKENNVAIMLISHDLSTKEEQWDSVVEIEMDSFSRIRQPILP